jgi:hypothetical protein
MKSLKLLMKERYHTKLPGTSMIRRVLEISVAMWVGYKTKNFLT